MTGTTFTYQLETEKNLAASDPAEHVLALGMLAATGGWTVLEGDGPLVLTSPCHQIGVGYETASAETGRPQLAAVAYTSTSVARWCIGINGHMPAELIGVVMTTLQHELDRDPDALIYGVGDGQAPLVLQHDETAWTWQEPDATDAFSFALLSADQHVALYGHPFGDAPAEPGGHPDWLVVASTAPDKELWSMRIGRGVPHHFAARLLNHVLDTTPVLRPGTDLCPEARPNTRERI